MTLERIIPATQKQRSLLAGWGYADQLDGLTLTQASELIEKAKAQRDAMVDEAKRKAEDINLIELAGRRIELKDVTPTEYAGPCPKCGGDDRFHVTRTWFFCRKCHEKLGDVIEYMTWIGDRNFMDVCAELTGGPLTSLTAEPLIQPQLKPKPQRQPPDTAKFTQIANDANHALFTDPYAEVGRQFLIDRGIEAHCWEKFNLGYRPNVPLPGTWNKEKGQYILPKHPAIVIPWYRGRKVVAIRYRFLKWHEYIDVNGDLVKKKQNSQPTSQFSGNVYGAHALPEWSFEPTQQNGRRGENYCTLVICEGELNAISIWQTCNHWNWEVLSLGGESVHVPQVVIDQYAKHFQRVLIWKDNPDKASAEMANVGSLAYAVHSIPVLDEAGKPVIGDDGKPRRNGQPP